VKVAIVDLGTNTCRLFLARVAGAAGAPRLEEDERLTRVVRLGEGVDRRGRLAPAAVARTRACLADYAARLVAYGPARRLLLATSVLRDAADGRAFLAAVRRDFGLPTRVLAGEEEARLSFRGGTALLPADAVVGRRPDGGPVTAAAAGRLLLVDVGGGSTELAVGPAGGEPSWVVSVDVGAVRLTERFLRHDPPRADEVAALEAHLRRELAAAVPATRRAAGGALGVAGTFTTLVALRLGLREYDRSRVHGHLLTLADIDEAVARFLPLTHAGRAALPGVQPGREDVILAGALIAREVLRLFGLAAVRCSESDLLEGAALALCEGGLAPDAGD